jgi:anti-sigma regulatory factor (Ser/Thr protein kinase)
VSATATASGSWPAEAAAVLAARLLVRQHLAGQRVAAVGDDAELLVSELVANVVLHVGGTVGVTVRTSPDEVVLEVSDDSPAPPALRSFSRSSSTGRGMRLVHSLSADHGVSEREQGKTVWVRLTAVAAGRDEEELVASFAEIDWLAQLELDDTDDVTAWTRTAPETAAASPSAA